MKKSALSHKYAALIYFSLVFTTTVLVPMTLDGKALFTWLILWEAVLWMVVLVISLTNKGMLLQKPDHTIKHHL